MQISKTLLEELSVWQIQSTVHLDKNDPLSTIGALGYHYIQLTIFRAIMRPFVAMSSSNIDPAESGQHGQTSQTEVIGFARTGVRTSTAAAAKFVNDLKEEHSHIFWPQWTQVAFSSICYMNLTMAMSSPDAEEATTWFQSLQNIRREMRLKASMLPVLRLGLLRIDSLFWKGLGKVLHLQAHVKDAFENSMGTNSG